MIADKLVSVLLESAMDSLALLERLEAKVDAQAIGKLRGAFRSLETAGQQRDGAALAIQMALSSFTESAEYFRSLITSINSELGFDRKLARRTKVGKVLGWGKYMAGSVRDLVGLGGGQLNKHLRLEAERIDCVNLLMLSEIGRIACMDALDFDAKVVSRNLDSLRSADFEVDPDPYLGGIVKQGMLPSHVARMEGREFEQHYGEVLDYDALQPTDERQEMKAFVIEHYGSTIDEIKESNPGYKSVCLEAGREPTDLDDYVDMVMARSTADERFFDKLEEWGGKKFLYWADKDILHTWTQAFFRYAALRTLLTAHRVPRELLAAVASRGL
jgi:hypothetical protein